MILRQPPPEGCSHRVRQPARVFFDGMPRAHYCPTFKGEVYAFAAANAAIMGPAPFGPPFTILCALSLASLVLGPIAAAAALRHGLE